MAGDRPIRTEFDLGGDFYDRRSRLIVTYEGGRAIVSIVTDPLNQRDEGEIIRSLSPQQILRAAEILAPMRGAFHD